MYFSRYSYLQYTDQLVTSAIHIIQQSLNSGGHNCHPEGPVAILPCTDKPMSSETVYLLPIDNHNTLVSSSLGMMPHPAAHCHLHTQSTLQVSGVMTTTMEMQVPFQCRDILRFLQRWLPLSTVLLLLHLVGLVFPDPDIGVQVITQFSPLRIGGSSSQPWH